MLSDIGVLIPFLSVMRLSLIFFFFLGILTILTHTQKEGENILKKLTVMYIHKLSFQPSRHITLLCAKGLQSNWHYFLKKIFEFPSFTSNL